MAVSHAAILRRSLMLAGRGGDHGGNTGQTEFAGEAAVAVQPIDLVRHRDGALLDAPVSLVGVIGAVALTSGSANRASISSRRVGWLAFTAGGSGRRRR
jgi:hypothetical protein